MTITIPTNLRKFYRLSLEVIRSIKPLDTLRYQELNVLAEILYWDYVYKELPKEERWKMVFNYDTKLQMREFIYMNVDQFNNCLTSLRKKGIIKSKGVINNYGISPENPFVSINFKIS